MHFKQYTPSNKPLFLYYSLVLHLAGPTPLRCLPGIGLLIIPHKIWKNNISLDSNNFLSISIIGLFDTEPDPLVVDAFQGMLLVTPAAPVYPWFDNFSRIINEYLEAAPFHFVNGFKDKSGKGGNIRKIVSWPRSH